MQIREHIKNLSTYLVMFTLGGIGAAQVYLLHRSGDITENYVALSQELDETKDDLRATELRLINMVRDKQEACRILTTIASKQYSYSMCKDEN
jgi:Tfp pilus assembly protein PilX